MKVVVNTLHLTGSLSPDEGRVRGIVWGPCQHSQGAKACVSNMVCLKKLLGG